MMNTEADYDNSNHPLLDKTPVGLPVETVMSLTESARTIYDLLFDYCTYSSDPQYKTLHKFRNRIACIKSKRDRDILINYFNNDPAIQWNGMPCKPWEYYEKPY